MCLCSHVFIHVWLIGHSLQCRPYAIGPLVCLDPCSLHWLALILRSSGKVVSQPQLEMLRIKSACKAVAILLTYVPKSVRVRPKTMCAFWSYFNFFNIQEGWGIGGRQLHTRSRYISAVWSFQTSNYACDPHVCRAWYNFYKVWTSFAPKCSEFETLNKLASMCLSPTVQFICIGLADTCYMCEIKHWTACAVCKPQNLVLVTNSTSWESPPLSLSSEQVSSYIGAEIIV